MEVNDSTKTGMENAPALQRTEVPPKNDREFAGLLARNLEGKALYVPEIKGGWMIYNGLCWRRDDSDEILHLAGQVADQMMRDTAALDIDQDEKTRRLREIIKMPNRKRMENAVKLLQPLLRASITTFDADPWIIGTPSGMVDLRTGQFLEPDPDARITKATSADLDPNATCPLWMDFLNTVLAGDRDLIEFIRRSIGYALTGHSREHYLWFCYGSGENGKTVFIETVITLMGDYANKASNKLFCNVKHGRDPEQEIAALKGSRFVVGEELESDARLAEARVKDITGGDTLRGRLLYAEPFSFSPTHATWMFGNYRPVVFGTDHGIWRRILPIPFTVKIPKEQRDKELAKKLQEEELPGIFAWAVSGAMAWRQHGIEVPQAVLDAAADYREDEDLLGEFARDWVVEDPDSTVSFDETYAAYRDWCEGQGIPRPWMRKVLNQRLRDRGWREQRKASGMVWCGRRLKQGGF